MKSGSRYRIGWLAAAQTALLLMLAGTASATDPTWESREPLPTKRAGLGAVGYGGLVYAAGGAIDGVKVATLEAYDPALDTWSSRASMSVAREDFGFAELGGRLYATGGANPSGSLTSVEAYDPVADAWSTCAALPHVRRQHAAAASGGRLYVIGGYDHASQLWLDAVHAYDPATNSWSTCASLPTVRIALGAATIDGKIYAVGGAGKPPPGQTLPNLGTLEVYDPATDSWDTLEPMPTPRHRPAVGVVDGRLVVTGGSHVTGDHTDVVEVYDPATDTWDTLPSMPEPMHSAAAATLDGSLYVIAGARGEPGNHHLVADVIALVPASNVAPSADAGSDQAVDCTSSEGAEVTLDGTGSSDADGDVLTYQWSVPAGVVLDDPESAQPTGIFPLGVHLVTLVVSDGQGGTSTDDVVIEVLDGDPPQAFCTTDLVALWPPDHTMVDVEVHIVANDLCTDPADLVLTGVTVTSDEPDDATGNGDGATSGDVDGEDGFAAPVDVASAFTFDASLGAFVGTIRLRAERSGAGDGRTYAITAVVEDAGGLATSAGCVVVVPHSRRK